MLLLLDYMNNGSASGAPVRDIYGLESGSNSLGGATGQEDYWAWYGTHVGGGAGRDHQTRRVHRKLSADSLLDTRTYQMEDYDPTAGMVTTGSAAGEKAHTIARGGRMSSSSTSLSGRGERRAQREAEQAVPPPSSRARELQLARKPLQVRDVSLTIEIRIDIKIDE